MSMGAYANCALDPAGVGLRRRRFLRNFSRLITLPASLFVKLDPLTMMSIESTWGKGPTMGASELQTPRTSPRVLKRIRALENNNTREIASMKKSSRKVVGKMQRQPKALALQLKDVEGCAHQALESPLGRVTVVASPQGVHAVLLSGKDGSLVEQEEVARSIPHAPHDPLLSQARKELEEYFKGQRTEFSLPLAPLGGTSFQRLVWASLQLIPFGQKVTYGEQALSMGLTGAASRAVGAANGKNPLAIVVPCHRVVGKSGVLTGYAGGLDKKEFLLGLEAQVAA